MASLRMPFDMELDKFDTSVAYLNVFPGGLRGGIGRPPVSSPVTQEEHLEVGHFEGPLLLTESQPIRHLSVPPTDSEGTVCMADVHPPPPAMPEFDPEPLGTEAGDIDVHVSDEVDQHTVNLTTIDDIMVDRLTSAEGHSIPADESRQHNQCRRSARLTLRPTVPIKSLNKSLLWSHTSGATKEKANAQPRRRAKCPNGCLKTFSRAYDARRHASETMLCRGCSERKSYPCPNCWTVFTRSDALLRHQSRRDDKRPACKAMRIV